MPASIRIIKIVKDPFTKVEAYTVEFECETEKAKDLINELTSSPYGQRVIELLNEAKFLPEVSNKTQEELKAEADKEEEEREKHESDIRETGRKLGINEIFDFLKEKYGEDFRKEVEAALEEKRKKEEATRLALDANNESETE